MNLADYDVFNHFRKSVFWGPHDLIVPLTAHFDASGTDPRDAVWAVGGWIAPTDQWVEVNRAWALMLKETRFRADIEKKDRIFQASRLESLKGIYSDWTQDEKQEFQNRAYTIIKDYQLFPIASAVIKADYKALRIGFPKLKWGDGSNYFQHTFHDILNSVRKWLDVQRYEASVHYIFEAGDIGQSSIGVTLRQINSDPHRKSLFRMSGWTFSDKTCLPLQVADIWAYESYKQMINRIVNGPLRSVRYPYQKLYRREFERYQTFWDRENLLELIKTYHQVEAERSGRTKPQ